MHRVYFNNWYSSDKLRLKGYTKLDISARLLDLLLTSTEMLASTEMMHSQHHSVQWQTPHVNITLILCAIIPYNRHAFLPILRPPSTPSPSPLTLVIHYHILLCAFKVLLQVQAHPELNRTKSLESKLGKIWLSGHKSCMCSASMEYSSSLIESVPLGTWGHQFKIPLLSFIRQGLIWIALQIWEKQITSVFIHF